MALPHAEILHGPGLEIHQRQVVDPRRHRGAQRGPSALLDGLHRVGRHVLHDVDLARQQGGHARAELGNEAEGHAAGIGRALPVVGIALEHQPLVPLPLHELERPGADGLLGQLGRPQLLEGLGRHDERVRRRRAVDQVRPRLLGDEAHRVVVDDHDFLDEAPVRGGREVRLGGRIEGEVDGGLHRGRRERLAVVELHARRSLNSQVVSLTIFQLGGQHRLGLEGLAVTIEQTVVDVLEHVVGRPVHDHDAEHGARLGPEPDDDLLRLDAVLGGRHGDERGDGHDDERDHHETTRPAHALVLPECRIGWGS